MFLVLGCMLIFLILLAVFILVVLFLHPSTIPPSLPSLPSSRQDESGPDEATFIEIEPHDPTVVLPSLPSSRQDECGPDEATFIGPDEATFMEIEPQDPTVVAAGICIICLVEYLEGEDEVIILPECRHAFHAACLNLWLRQKSTCPLCRSPAPGNGVMPESS